MRLLRSSFTHAHHKPAEGQGPPCATQGRHCLLAALLMLEEGRGGRPSAERKTCGCAGFIILVGRSSNGFKTCRHMCANSVSLMGQQDAGRWC